MTKRGDTDMDTRRNLLKKKQRVVIKIGSSSLTHPETGELNLTKIEKLIRVLSDLRGEGKEVVLVSSGAIAAGRQAFGHHKRPDSLAEKQAFAAVGQARLMMIYQKLFSEYNQLSAQILMTKNTMVNNVNRKNAQNTFNELLSLGVIPIVNENDSISTYELQNLEKFGDNDTLSAMVAALVRADLLILLSDIDGLFTDDPNTNPDAKFIDVVENLEVVTPGITTPVRRLSGGNVQKVLVGREIASAPTVLLTAYAVRGLDINSSYTIYDLINEQKKKGVAVIFVGEDLDVLMELSDRIMVLCGGEVSGILDARKTDKNEVGMLMTRVGGKEHEGEE